MTFNFFLDTFPHMNPIKFILGMFFDSLVLNKNQITTILIDIFVIYQHYSFL